MYQNDVILDYMKSHDGISTYVAFQMGITRLAARIKELRDDGHKIISERKMSKERKPYVLYRLEDE